MNEQQMIIFELQEYLRNIAKVNPDVTLIIPDGIYGEETVRAVNDFQRQQNIKQTGEVDFITWQSLVEQNNNAMEQIMPPVQTAPITNKDLPLQKGDENTFVTQLKIMLSHVAEEFINFEKLLINEVFDELTEKQVINWQRVINEPMTGVVNKRTWNTLSDYYLLRTEEE